jgi:gliding motility-associated-like protein
MKKHLLFLTVFFAYFLNFAQSDNCNSATVLTLNSSGNACFSGTTANATSSLTTNGCIANPVNEVWFTYTVMGPQNNFTVTPGTLRDAVITIYADGCNTGTFDYCNSTTGSSTLNASFGLAIGSQVWISVASNTLTDGTFEFCVQSIPPPPGQGNTCGEAISVCQKNQTLNVPNMGIYTASGVKASCFQGPGSNPTQEMWISFCVSQSGTITWSGNPANNFTEYDWSMWDITNGCPGTEVACNYAWNQQSGATFGMGCNTTDCNPALNAVAGRCYAIQIVNWSNNGTGFTFSGIGGTALISPNVNFSLSQTAQCNIPVTASFSTLTGHAGVINWNFGNGNTWSGTGAPANQVYTQPGVYAVTATGGSGACLSTQTRYVYVYEPLQVTHTVVDDFCNDTNGGAISLFPTGGNGVYTYAWTPAVSTGPNATGLPPGNYSVQVCNTTCAQCVTIPVTLTGIVCCGVDIDFGPTRLCMSDSPINLNPTITGATNYNVQWTPNDFLSDPLSENTLFTPPSAGTYTFTFAVDNTADPGGCVTPRNVTYTVVDVFPVGQTTQTSCPGTCDGAVQITGVSGGLSPYVVTWDNGLSSANAHSGLCAGTYTATVTEAGGCEGYLALQLEDAVGFLVDAGSHDCATNQINPGECLELNGISSIIPPFLCDNTNHTWSGNTAIADPVGTGQGTPSNTTQSVSVTGVTGDDFLTSICFTINHQDHNQLRNIFITSPDGTQIFYFQDATFSFATANGSVTYCFEQDKIDAYTGPINGTWTLTLQDFRRNPSATGSITNITITTCRRVFPELWSPTTNMIGNPINLITEVCPTETTTYTLTVTDQNGCSISDQITVFVGPCPCDANATISRSGNSQICQGECSEIQFQVGDGIGPYEIIYTDGTSNYTVEISGSTQLAAGTYSIPVCPNASVTYSIVSVFDFGASCFANISGAAEVNVTIPALPLFTQLGPFCHNGLAGTLPNTSNNGFNGSWSPAAINTSTVGISAYTFTPTTGQCATSTSMDIEILALPVISGTNQVCIGSTTALSGSSTPALSNPWISSNTAIATVSSTGVVTGVSPGSVTITYTNSSGCQQVTNITVNPTPVITLTPSDPSVCNGTDGSIQVNGSGTGNITWSGAATGSILGVPLPQTITGLGAGNYNVRFTDITTGCSSATVTAALNNPGAPVITPISDYTSCGINYVLTMDSISGTNLTSGVGFFASPNGADPIDLATNSVITAAMSPTIVYVFDNNGTCGAEISFVVTVNEVPVISGSPEVCVGSQIDLSATTDPSLTAPWNSSNSSVASINSDGRVTGVSAGSAQITYTDENGCTDNFQVTVNPNPEISGILSVCVGLTTTLSATNTPNATSPWVSSNPAIATVDNFGVVTGVAAGSAQITYTDVNGCTDMETVVVNANPVISLTAADPSVCNGTDGSILVDGTGSGSLIWSGTASGSNGSVSLPFTITNLAAGTYNVTFTNTTTGCVSNNPSTTLSDPNSPILNPIGNVIACEGEFVVPAYTEISGSNMTGSQAFYSASGGNGLLAPGTVITAAMSPMTIYAYDIDGDCFSEVSFTVTINALPTVTSITGSGEYCEDELVSDVLVTVTGSSDWTLNYILDGVAQTSTGSVSPLNLGNAAGVYTLTSISDANCTNTATGSATIVVFPRPDAPSVSDAVTYCSTVVFDAMTATGGSGTMTWYTDEDLTSVYGTGNSIAPANVLGATTYYVTETANGCEGPSSSIVITVEGCDIIVSTAITPNGDGNNDRWVIPNLDDAYPDAIVRIYNRWGSLLFEHNSATMGKYNDNAWDGSFNGTALPVGSYFFIIEFNDANKEKLNGAVSIILQ